jgi:hypothetical protein
VTGGFVIAQSRTPYVETFDHGAGGWIANRRDPLPIWDGAAYCIGPWFLDPNHAPPGAGYLHLLMYLTTGAKWLPYENAENRFIEQRKSTNLLNARFTLRLRGLFDLSEKTPNPVNPRLGEVPMGLQGSELLLLVQAETQKTTANFVLTGQPFQITREWSEQTIVLKPDPKQWTCLGSRHDLADEYGCAEIAEVLRDVNVDFILVLFPLKVIPTGEIADLHRPRAGEDYPVRQEVLPKGLLMVDTVKIEYP